MELTTPDQWFVLRVKPRFEKNVASVLRHKRLEVFLPLINSRRSWTHRQAIVTVALFPGYIFCRFGAGDRMLVLTTPGVLGLLGIDNIPAPVPEREIETIRCALKSGREVSAHEYLTVGQTVRIESGPLCGVEGILTAVKKHHVLVVSIQLLQRSISVDISPDNIVAMSEYEAYTERLMAKRAPGTE